MTRAAFSVLVDAATALARRDELAFVEVTPAQAANEASEAAPGSIPGAFEAGIRTHFTGTPSTTSMAIPTTDPDLLRRRASGWTNGRRLLLYTRRAEDFTTATRAWLSLAYAGIGEVSVLDGGLPAWTAAGGPLEPIGPEPDAVPAVEVPETSTVQLLRTDDVLDIAAFGTLLDARPIDAYRGVLDDPRSGHIPGALSAPAAELMGSDGLLRPRADLRRWLLTRRAIGHQSVGVYCGSGGASSAIVFVGALLGQSIALYVDSWPSWAGDQSLPVEHGDALARSSATDLDCVD